MAPAGGMRWDLGCGRWPWPAALWGVAVGGAKALVFGAAPERWVVLAVGDDLKVGWRPMRAWRREAVSESGQAGGEPVHVADQAAHVQAVAELASDAADRALKVSQGSAGVGQAVVYGQTVTSAQEPRLVAGASGSLAWP